MYHPVLTASWYCKENKKKRVILNCQAIPVVLIYRPKPYCVRLDPSASIYCPKEDVASENGRLAWSWPDLASQTHQVSVRTSRQACVWTVRTAHPKRLPYQRQCLRGETVNTKRITHSKTKLKENGGKSLGTLDIRNRGCVPKFKVNALTFETELWQHQKASIVIVNLKFQCLGKVNVQRQQNYGSQTWFHRVNTPLLLVGHC